MKIILFLSLNPFFTSSASGNRYEGLITGLLKHGAKVRLVITGGYNNLHEYLKKGARASEKNLEVLYFNQTFNHNIWLRRINKFILNPLLKPFVNYRILRLGKKYPDAIFWTGSDLEGFEIAVRLKKQNQELKTFLEISEFLDIHQYNRARSVHLKEGDRRQRFFENKAYFAYDGIALMTKTLMKHYQVFPKPGPKLLHLPMTVDLARFNKEFEPLKGFVKPYIAFVGVMNNAKEGIDVLLEAFALIASQYPDYRLYLVGSWHYDTPGHKKSISDLGLADRVFWMGEYNRDAIPAIIKNARLLVLPRPDSKQVQGGFPTKLGEYLATGNPVCATGVGEIPDYLGDGESVYFAEPGSVESFANAMQRALSNPEQAAIVGANGRKVAEIHFNKDTQVKILYDFLKENLQTNNKK